MADRVNSGASKGRLKSPCESLSQVATHGSERRVYYFYKEMMTHGIKSCSMTRVIIGEVSLCERDLKWYDMVVERVLKASNEWKPPCLRRQNAVTKKACLGYGT
jgi:hypothetical protein